MFVFKDHLTQSLPIASQNVLFFQTFHRRFKDYSDLFDKKNYSEIEISIAISTVMMMVLQFRQSRLGLGFSGQMLVQSLTCYYKIRLNQD